MVWLSAAAAAAMFVDTYEYDDDGDQRISTIHLGYRQWLTLSVKYPCARRASRRSEPRSELDECKSQHLNRRRSQLLNIPVPMPKSSVGAVHRRRCQMDAVTDISSSCTITSGQNTFLSEKTDSAGREIKPQQQQNHGNAARFAGFYCMIFTLATLLTTVQAAGRCYVNGPGTSIQGADYRRDYDITLRHCAVTCREDPCCMAFEWLSDGMCTLKTRSLNGTIANIDGVYFGLCLDTDDVDRNRFWDHVVFGPETGSVPAIDREECADFCSTLPDTQMYSWQTSNPRNMDEPIGDCTCIKELNRIQLHFGSFAGVLAQER